MKYYSNLDGGSRIHAYEISDDSIKVQFNTGSIYVFTHSSAGYDNIEHMKRLAESGNGLNRFISRNVKDKYSRKIKK
jgi:hypothetical protein